MKKYSIDRAILERMGERGYIENSADHIDYRLSQKLKLHESLIGQSIISWIDSLRFMDKERLFVELS